MPCDFKLPKGMTQPQRKKQVEDAIARLDKALAIGTVKVRVGSNGAVAFAGEWDRVGLSDTCAFRKLQAQGSPALRSALARAEALAGRQVDARAVAAGVHSHDGGSTWHKGH